MEIQLINISEFCGIGAEHLYAKYVDREKVEMELACMDMGLEDLCHLASESLRYFPSREEAEAYAKKDYPERDATMTPEEKRRMREWAVEDILEDGTIRFPSLLAVVKTARERWPEANLYFTYEGSRRDFLKIISKKNRIKPDPEFEELLIPRKGGKRDSQ